VIAIASDMFVGDSAAGIEEVFSRRADAPSTDDRRGQ
jgi:hypothetical protein